MSNLSAFLRVIREGESSQDDVAYRMMFGGDLFDDFSQHPNIANTASGLTSTAAGAYQFLYRTWQGLNLPDFSPENQDRGAVKLIQRRGALQDVEAGNFTAAIQKCNREWASLPGSPYGQPVITMARAKAVYEQYGGTLLPSAKENTMPSPFLNIALGALTSAIPSLGALFANSPTGDRNAKAAEIIVGIAKDALGAVNEQELVENLKVPESVAVVEKAVQDNWFVIQEAGGGGISGAAQRSLDLARSNTPLRKNGSFIITLLLLPLVYTTVYAVYWGDNMPPDLKVMTVTAMVTGVLAGIMGFWMGTSFSSSRKTDLLTKR